MQTRLLLYLVMFFLFINVGGNKIFAQVRWLEGRWLIKNAKQDAFENKTLRLRRFREADKFKNLSICLNFKKETGYVLEEKFWKVELTTEQGAGAKTFGYSGDVLTWVWESKDKFKVFCGNAFREYRIKWLPGSTIVLKEMHSRTPSFQKPFKHNLSSR